MLSLLFFSGVPGAGRSSQSSSTSVTCYQSRACSHLLCFVSTRPGPRCAPIRASGSWLSLSEPAPMPKEAVPYLDRQSGRGGWLTQPPLNQRGPWSSAARLRQGGHLHRCRIRRTTLEGAEPKTTDFGAGRIEKLNQQTRTICRQRPGRRFRRTSSRTGAASSRGSWTRRLPSESTLRSLRGPPLPEGEQGGTPDPLQCLNLSHADVSDCSRIPRWAERNRCATQWLYDFRR